MTLPADQLENFIELARHGERATASEREHAAYRLAQAVLDDVPTLDEADLRGLTVFIGVAKFQCDAMRKRLHAETETTGTEFVLPRSGSAPLAFTGELVGRVSGQQTRPDKTNKRWHEIDLFRADSDKYVVAIRFRCETKHDDPYDDAEVLTSPKAVSEFLETYDPVERVRGWPLDRHRQEDQRLREALTANFDRLVSQLLASRSEFAERL